MGVASSHKIQQSGLRKNQSSCNFLKRTRKLNAPSKDIPSPSQSFEAAWLCCSVTSWLATWKTHRSQNPPTFLRPCCRGFVDARRLPALLYPKGDPNDPNDLILILLKIGTMIIRFLSEKDIILLSQWKIRIFIPMIINDCPSSSKCANYDPSVSVTIIVIKWIVILVIITPWVLNCLSLFSIIIIIIVTMPSYAIIVMS